MQSIPPRKTRYVILWFLAIIFMGCKATRPSREMLPEEPGGKRIYEKGITPANALFPLPFYVTDSLVDGKRFTVVQLNDPGFDSLAFGIIRSYEPFASSLLSMINSEGIKGVMIDFRTGLSELWSRSSFRVSGNNNETDAGETPVKIDFLWDESSQQRATAFMNELESTVAVSVMNLDNNKMNLLPVYQQGNCFSSYRPGFDD